MSDAGASSLPTVTVVVPTHNRPELLRRAVAAIVDQDYAGVVECLIVHDAEPADQSIASVDPRRPIIVLENRHRRGLTGCRNTGLDIAHGDLIGWCDDDDLWHPNKLSMQVALLNSSPGAQAVGSGFRRVSADGSVVIGSKSVAKQRDIFLHGHHAFGLHSSTALVRRCVYDRIGRYDESLPENRLEDVEFFLRLTAVAPVPICPEPLVDVLVQDPRGGTFNRDRRRTMAEAAQVLLQRYADDLNALPQGRARLMSRIASYYSNAGMHAEAFRWSRRSLRIRPYDRGTILTLAMSVLRIPAAARFPVIRRMTNIFRRRRTPDLPGVSPQGR